MDFIIVQDTDIITVTRSKRKNEASSINYRDKFGQLHSIDFDTCALNFATEHNNTSGSCIGERNISEGYFILYTSGFKTKIVFQKLFSVNFFRLQILQGTKRSRFLHLQKLISETRFTTYDLS